MVVIVAVVVVDVDAGWTGRVVGVTILVVGVAGEGVAAPAEGVTGAAVTAAAGEVDFTGAGWAAGSVRAAARVAGSTGLPCSST